MLYFKKQIIMKKIIYFISFIILFAACMRDVLDRKPLNMISDADVWISENLIDIYITALYDNIPIGMCRGGGVFECHLTDEATIPYSGEFIVKNFGNRSLSLNTGMYTWIRRANYFLEKIEESTLSQNKKKLLTAEVRFIRAYYYFDLAKKYGGMPIIKEVQTFEGDIEPLLVSRNKEEEVYDFILKELDEAILDLPEKWDSKNSNRATKTVGLALKSRAMLYAGSIARYGKVQLNGLIGIPSSRAEYFFTESMKASKTIIDSKKYSLYDKAYDPISKSGNPAENYRLIFVDEGNKEVIFQKAYNIDNRHAYDNYNMPQSFKPGCCGNSITPILEMVESYEYVDGSDGKLNYENKEFKNPADLFINKDPRFEGTIMYSGSFFVSRPVQIYRGIYSTKGTLYQSFDAPFPEDPSMKQTGRDGPYVLGDVGKTGFYIKKYLNTSSITPEGYSTQNYIDFRYAEILLNYAEASMETKSEPSLTLNAINEIRKRAGICPLNIDELTMERLRNERKIELAFEDKRFWDIRRWRIGTMLFRDTYIHGLWPYLIHKGKGEYSYTFKKHEGIPIDGGYSRVWEEKDYYSNLSGYISTNKNIVNNPGW